MQVEVNAAEGTLTLGLADDDGVVFIQGNAVPEVGIPIHIGLDGLLGQRDQRVLALLRGFVETDNEALVGPQGLVDFLFKKLD